MNDELEFISQNNLIDGIVHPIINLELYQTEFIYNIHEKFNILKVSRQMGMSSLLKSYAAWCLLNQKDVVFISPSSQINKLFKQGVVDIINHNKEILENVGFSPSINVKNRHNNLIVNNFALITGCRRDAIIGYRVNNGVLIVDCADNISNLNSILEIPSIPSSGFDKLLVVGNNSHNDTDFNRIFNSEEPFWNKIKLDYTLCSRLYTREEVLRGIMGERFDIEFGLK